MSEQPTEREKFYRRFVVAFAAFKRRGGSQSALARKVSRGQGTVSQWFNDEVRAMPDGEAMLLLPNALGVDERWFLTGVGEMEPGPVPAPAAALYRGADFALHEVEEAVKEIRSRWDAERRQGDAAEAEAAAQRVKLAKAADKAAKKGRKGA